LLAGVDLEGGGGASPDGDAVGVGSEILVMDVADVGSEAVTVPDDASVDIGQDVEAIEVDGPEDIQDQDSAEPDSIEVVDVNLDDVQEISPVADIADGLTETDNGAEVDASTPPTGLPPCIDNAGANRVHR